MEKYLFDLQLFVWQYLPHFLRRVFWLRFFEVLFSPLVRLHADFYAYAADARERANLVGTTMQMEYVLNNRFDNSNRGIYIENIYYNALIAQDYIYYILEGEPPPYSFYVQENEVGQLYASFLSEQYAFGQEFIIHIPIALQGVLDENELHALVNEYLLVDKTYGLNYY